MRLAITAIFVFYTIAAALAHAPSRHGYLPELDMDPMSVVFVVADIRLLDGVRKGDRVRFKPGLVGGRFGILEITPLRNERR